jgi:hypothetical protein
MVSNSNVSVLVLDIDRQALYICIEDMTCKLIWVYYIDILFTTIQVKIGHVVYTPEPGQLGLTIQ